MDTVLTVIGVAAAIVAIVVMTLMSGARRRSLESRLPHDARYTRPMTQAPSTKRTDLTQVKHLPVSDQRCSRWRSGRTRSAGNVSMWLLSSPGRRYCT
jgi:hypothetical protein